MRWFVAFLLFFVRRLACAWISLPTTTLREKIKIPENIKLLILPGFGNDSQDYFLTQAPQGSLVESLRKRGWSDTQIRVLPLQRSEWFKVFLRGALDLEFWKGNAPPTRPAFYWYLQRIAEEVEDLCDNDDTSEVVLLGHSAGGWLARAAMGFAPQVGLDLRRVAGIVTLGAPHLPPPPDIMDMTRGALRITHENFPGAHHQDEGIFYITVVGNVIRGIKQERKTPFEPTSITGFAYNSYEAVCGDGEALGDGVVPIQAAHLEGAQQIELNGVFHSINAPDAWYGSDSQLDRWHDALLQEINPRKKLAMSDFFTFR